MKISQMSEDEAKQLLFDSYMGAHSAYNADRDGRHPSKDLQRWIDIAASGGVGSEKPIQDKDVQPTVTEKGNAGAEPTMDGARRMSKALGKNYDRIK
jgi:hypothetical protein